jgi:hypothetical protein
MHGLTPRLVLLLALTTVAPAAEPPTPPPSVDPAQFRDAYIRWEAAQERVQRLEAQAYARNPLLRTVEKDSARAWAELTEEDVRDRADAVRYLNEHKNDPSVQDNYKSLMSFYGTVYLVEVLSDPQREAIIRAVALENPQFLALLTAEIKKQTPDVVKDWADPNQVWTALRNHLIAHKADAETTLNRVRAQYQFPPALENWARGNAISRINAEMLYGPYLQRNTSPELKSAREHAKELAGILNQLWPNWTKVEKTTAGHP